MTRINYLGRFSQAIQELCFDERLLHDATLASDHMRVCDGRLDGPMVFVKNANVVKGNGDLGWHVDDVLFRPDAEGRIGSRATTWKAPHDN